MKIRTYLLLIWLAVAVSSASGQSGIYLDSVEGQVAPGQVVAGRPVVFYLNLRNLTGLSITDISHEFKIFTPNGAEWHPRVFTYPVFDTTYYAQWLDPDGAGPLAWHTSDSGDIHFFTIIHLDARSDHDTNPQTPDQFGSGSDTIMVFGLSGLGIWDGLDLASLEIRN